MIISIGALVIGILLLAAGIYYLCKEKKDPESKKIYAITAAIGAAITIGIVIKIAALGL